ncbi:MAG: hypothetical protein QOF12_867, partial [Solirubrobacteraceae bacterium]|nr:hypothetical protein [Solirubrobacteraceae bacterium]
VERIEDGYRLYGDVEQALRRVVGQPEGPDEPRVQFLSPRR